MHVNFLIILVAAIIPMITGFIWYNPKVFGTAWKNAAGLTDEKMKGANMGVIFGLAFVLSFLLAMSIQFMVIHQFALYSLFAGQPIDDVNTKEGALFKSVIDHVGHNYHTFSHGLFHGTIGGFFLALPLLGTNALFERKGFKYVAINAGYWIVTMALMGGVICAFW